jgi:hypothetical protein
MKVGIIQFSDIHVKEDESSLAGLNLKIDSLADIIRAESSYCDKVFLVATGDVAYSGKLKEYENAKTFVDCSVPPNWTPLRG